MTEPSRDVPIGPHVATILAPDVIRIRWIGDVYAEHILELHQVLTTMPHEGRGIFLLVDQRAAGHLTAGARKMITHDPNSRLVRELVYYHTSFHIRVIATLLKKGMDVFRPNNAAMTFHDSEPAALAYVDETRRQKPQGNIDY